MTFTEELPIVSDDMVIQGVYESLRESGLTHNLAEMFAFRQPPMSNSDREFLEGRGGCYDQFPGAMAPIGDRYRKMAEAAGVNTTGKIYQGSLAERPGDPRAWVSSKDDVKRICEERGWGCTGAVNVKANNDRKPIAATGIADDLVQEVVEERLEATPGLADTPELRQNVRDEIKPTWADTLE